MVEPGASCARLFTSEQPHGVKSWFMTLRTGLLLCAVLLGALVPAGSVLHAQEGEEPKPAVPLPKPPPLARTGVPDSVNSDLKSTEEFRKRLAAELEAAKGDRVKLNQLLVESAARARDLEQQLIDVEGRIALLDRSATELKASLAQRRGVLADVLAALMRMGREPPPALLMRPDDALDAVRSAILLGALLPELRVEAETLAADLSELSRVRNELTQARTALTNLSASLEEDRKRLAALTSERQRRQQETHPVAPADKAQADTVARGSGDVHDLVTRVETEVGPAARAADEAKASEPPADHPKPDLAALNDAARLKPALAFSDAKGLLPLPVAGVRLHEFGAPDTLGGAEKGLTIATRSGAVVTAPADGWVVYAGPFRSYGQLLILNAGGGYHILMAGMERITVDLGQFVLAGEPVAVMGRASKSASSGVNSASGQPQLYVEFRKDGVSIDPTPWWAATDSRKVRG